MHGIIASGLGVGGASTGDVFWSDVACLLHFDTDLLLDVTGSTWSLTGASAVLSSSHSMFGSVSMQVNGKSSDIRTAAGVLVATDSFTVEMFFRLDSSQVGGNDSSGYWRGALFGQGGNAGNSNQVLGISKNGGVNRIVFQRGSTLGPAILLIGSTVVSENIWHFVQLTYDSAGDKFQIWLNGNLEGEVSATAGWINTGQPVRIGRHTVVGYESFDTGFNGWIDEVRVTKISNRPHTIPAEPFPDHAPV